MISKESTFKNGNFYLKIKYGVTCLTNSDALECKAGDVQKQRNKKVINQLQTETAWPVKSLPTEIVVLSYNFHCLPRGKEAFEKVEVKVNFTFSTYLFFPPHT